jgi:hypothetical protein
MEIRLGKLEIKTFQKKLNTYSYPRFNSTYTSVSKRGFIKGELIRYLRNSTSSRVFQRTCLLFKLRLIRHGYLPCFFNGIFKTVTWKDKSRYMVIKKKTKTFPLIMKIEYTRLNLGKTIQKILTYKKHNLSKEIKTTIT